MDEIKKQDRSPYFACFVNKHNEAFEISARRLIMERIKTPKDIMRSAVPLPCLFDVAKIVKRSRAAAPTGDKVL